MEEKHELRAEKTRRGLRLLKRKCGEMEGLKGECEENLRK